MLSALKIADTIEVAYSGVAPAMPVVTFNLLPGIPYNLAYISSEIVAAGAIVIASYLIRDNSGALLASILNIPFQNPGTTVNPVVTQSPEVPLTAFFGDAIGGFIPSDLHVFNGWSIQFTDVIATPGVTVNAIIGLTRSWQKRN